MPLPPSTLRAALAALALLLSAAQNTHAEEVILQYFNTDWSEIERRMPELAEAGYTSLWLPPPFKGASGTYSVGFDTFDRFDLGDKDQMGTVRTRYGTKADLLSLMRAAHRFGLKVYFDNVMAHNGGPLDSGTDEGELFPGLPGFVPQDFHLGRDGTTWRKFSDSINWSDEWQVLNRNPFGWDIAHEDWNTSFDPDGLLENRDHPKWRGIRHPGQTHYYLDLDLQVASDFYANPVYTFADKEPYQDTGYGAGNTGAGNGAFDWDDSDADGQHDSGELSEPFTDTGVDPSNPSRWTATWGYGDGIYNMGDPVDEDVNGMLLRQVRWFVDEMNADGFRLDAVKHVPSYFFGEQFALDKDKLGSGYNGQIQEQFNVSRGQTDWGNHRDTVYLNTLARDDALLFGEHLGAPPDWPEYLASGMRVANDNFLNQVGGFGGIGNSLGGYDQPGHGTIGTSIGISYPLSHDNNFMDGSVRAAAHAYMLTREGLGIVYTDGYNVEGAPSYFPKPSFVPFLGQYGQRWVTGPLKVRRDFVRGSQIPRWSDGDFAAWEMRDKRENTGMANADGTVLLVMMARGFTGGQARPVTTDFPAGARLRNYSEHGGAFHVTVVTVDGDQRVHDDSDQPPLVPSGGYFAFSWDNPRPPQVFDGDPDARPIEIYQGFVRAPWMDHSRFDGRDGDPAYAHSVRIPRVTDGSDLRILARADGSAVNMLMKLDGGIDINSGMNFGPLAGDKRDNPPPVDIFFENDAQDLFTGYEQMRYADRAVEKFAATDIARNVIGSQGAETWELTIGANGPENITRNNGAGLDTDTGTINWVYHDPEGLDLNNQPQLVINPGGIELIAKLGYGDDDDDEGWIYYTTDGVTYPEGSRGVGVGNTQVMPLFEAFSDTPDPGGTPTWWSGSILPLPQGTVLRYKIGVHRENAPTRFPFSQRDIDLKRRMDTQFEVASFNATTVEHYPHNDHGEMATGLDEGYHVLRTKAFLERTGRASIFHTEAQTFYYDTQRPVGQVLFPRNGDSIAGSAYGAVAVSDATVTEVWYNIIDTDDGNDSSTTGNGPGNWAQASAVATPTQLGDSGMSKEWRFDYLDIPASLDADIFVRFKEASSSTDNGILDDTIGHFTTIKIEVNTGSAINYRFGFPQTEGETIGGGYIAKVLFDKPLNAQLGEFAVSVDGFPIDASALSIASEDATDDALAIVMPNVYDGNPAAVHEIRVVHTRASSTLTATRTFLASVSALPDSDGDGLPDAWELAHGLEFNNPTGVHGAEGDYDADGVTNIGEYLAGTNPLLFDEEGFRLNAIGSSGAGIELTFPVVAGRRYRVWYSDDLQIWSPTPGFDILTGNPMFSWTDDGSFTVTAPGLVPRRYYRVEISMP